MAPHSGGTRSDPDTESRSSRNSCLLLFSNPFEATSTNTVHQEMIELVPIATQKRYIRATREFIEQSSPSTDSSATSSPIEVVEGKESKTFKLPASRNRANSSRPPPIARSWEMLQPTVYDPNENLDSMASRADNHQARNKAFEDYENTGYQVHRKEAAPVSRKDYQGFEIGAMASNYQGTRDLSPTRAYDHKAFPLPSKGHKNYSEGIGIPSPVSQNGPNFVNSPPEQQHSTQGHHQPALEAMIRAGSYDSERNADEDGFYIDLSAHSVSANSEVGELPDFRSVSTQNPKYNQGRPEIESVYAQVFAANPFGIDLSVSDGDDLSMRATLFPLKESTFPHTTGMATMQQLATQGSYAADSGSRSQSEDEIAIITQDFHRALSAIAKDKRLPSLPPQGVPSAKAMAVLGRFQSDQHSNGSTLQKGHKHKPAALKNQQIVQKKEEYYGKQQLKDALATLYQETEHAVLDAKIGAASRPSKLRSLLGVGDESSTSNISAPIQSKDASGPQTNSTLYNKLYSQVMKPNGTYRPESGISGFSAENNGYSKHESSFLTRNLVEPIKRSTLSPTNSLFHRKNLPESPVSSESKYSFSPLRDSFRVSPLKIEKKRDQNKENFSAVVQPSNPRAFVKSDTILGRSSAIKDRRSASSPAEDSDAYHSYKSLEKTAATRSSIDTLEERSLLQDMVIQSLKPHGQVLKARESFAQQPPKVGMKQFAGNVVPPTAIRRKPTPQQLDEFTNGRNPDAAPYFPPPPTKAAPTGSQRQASYPGSAFAADPGVPYKRPKSPVKKMFSSTVEKIGRIMPMGNNTGFVQASNGIVLNQAADLKISIHAADQNRLFGDLEYIIQDTANRFLLFQHAHGRLSSASVEKQVRSWHQKNRPQVAEFLYPITVQRAIVNHNLETIIFHGPLSGDTMAIQAIMHTWKYVAQELAVRSFCLPDAGLQHFLRESFRLLELLGVNAGHMLHFQAWYNVIAKTVRDNYQIPYAATPTSH